MAHVEIRTEGAGTRIYVDGQRLDDVTQFQLRQHVGEDFPTLELDVLVTEMNVSTEAEVRRDDDLVQVDPRYFEHLRRLEQEAIRDGRTTATAWEQ